MRIGLDSFRRMYLGVDGQRHEFTLPGSIAHELGHLVDGKEGLASESSNITNNENAVLQELGLALRDPNYGPDGNTVMGKKKKKRRGLGLGIRFR